MIKKHGGYIALMSALILSAMLMLLVFAANADVFIARANLSNAEDHAQARHYANACGSIALRMLSMDPSRLASSTPLQIQMSTNSACTILSGTISENAAESIVRAQKASTLSVLYIRASRASSTAPFLPNYWSELPLQ